MKITDMVTPLECTVAHRGSAFESADIDFVIASDLMSDVLVVDRSNLLLLTSLASDQAIRTADIVGACAVVVANGKALPANMVALAREVDLSLLRSPLTKFTACVRLGRLMNGA